MVERLHALALEGPLDRPVVAEAPPEAVHRRQDLGQPAAVELRHGVVGAAPVDEIEGRRDRRADRSQGEVPDHPNDLRAARRRQGRAAARRPAGPGDGPARRGGGGRVAQHPCGTLVQHHAGLLVRPGIRPFEPDVLAVVAHEEAPGQRLQPVHLEETDVDRRELQGDAGPAGLADHGVGPALPFRDVRGARRRPHPGKRRQLLSEVGGAGRVDAHDLVRVQPERVLQGEGGLPVDGRGDDDQTDQDGELGHHQHLAHPRSSPGLADAPL